MQRLITLFLLCSVTFVLSSQTTAEEFVTDGIAKKDNTDCEGAIVKYNSALAIEPLNFNALYEKGWCLNELQKYEEATKMLEKSSGVEPESVKSTFELAYAYDHLNNFEKAIENYKKVLSLDPDYYEAIQNLAYLYYDSDEYENAYDYFVQYVDSEPDPDNDAYYYAGWCANELEKYADAVHYFRNYFPEEARENAKKFSEIGFAWYKLENAAEAEQAYNAALSYESTYGAALRGLGDTYYDLKEDRNMALSYYEKAISNDPDNSMYLYYDIGWIYNEMERYQDAINMLSKAIDYDEQDSYAYVELGYANYMLDYNDAALSALKKAVEMNSESVLGLYYLGLTYLNLSRKSDAMDVYYKLKPMDEEYADKLLQEINEN